MLKIVERFVTSKETEHKLNIDVLLDILNSAHGALWMEVSEELLDLGYSWEYSARDDCYRLLDLYRYFA